MATGASFVKDGKGIGGGGEFVEDPFRKILATTIFRLYGSHGG